MEYRRLGKSGLPISELSFGSWITFGNQINDGVSERLMDIAYEAGVNFFDNAEVYAAGESEKVMGQILKKKNWSRDSYIVSSKVFFGAGPKVPTQRGLNRKHIVEACNQALQRLQVDYLDLYFCHRPDKQTPIEETVWSMPQLGVAWCLKHPNVSTVILGATKTEQLEETLKSTEILHKLTPEVMEHIETILQNKPQHPLY